MAVVFFFIDAPHIVPTEYRAWVTAKEHHLAIAKAFFAAPLGSENRARLNKEGEAAGVVADDLERLARVAWAAVNRAGV